MGALTLKQQHERQARERLARIRKIARDKALAEKEEKERRIARLKSLANIQRKAKIEAMELKIKEQETKRRLKKAEGRGSLSRVLFGKKKKKRSSGW